MRRGFTIVEVIATLLLLSIVFVTIPTFLSISVKSDETSLEGEALYFATVLIDQIANPSNDFDQMLNYGTKSDKYIKEDKDQRFRLEAYVEYVEDYDPVTQKWSDTASANTNTLLITVTALHSNDDEIGTLRYRASRIEVPK